MKLLIFCSRADERGLYEQMNQKYGFDITYTNEVLGKSNVASVKGYEAVLILTSTRVDREFSDLLVQNGVKYVLTRSAGIDHFDLAAMRESGLKAANVPNYSPSAIAEHTVMLILMLLRHMKLQFNKVQSLNFTMDGLRARELKSRTVGIFGTGRIGCETAKLLHGFGAKILACSGHEQQAIKSFAEYVSPDQLFAQSDILTFHCPLTELTRGIVNASSIAQMKDGVCLVNTARGALFDIDAVLEGLKSQKISALGLDVYENESEFVRKDKSKEGISNPVLKQLLDMDQFIFTPHVGFYTENAIRLMIEVSLGNLSEFDQTGTCTNEVTK